MLAPLAIIACFVPGDDCTGLVAGEIGAARTQVLVEAYRLTSPPIAAALTEAARRGVDVEIILDKGAARGPVALGLIGAGIPVRVEHLRGIAHNKVMVIDSETVITGSFNFTKAAQSRNAENLVVIRDPDLAARYAADWRRNAALSVSPP